MKKRLFILLSLVSMISCRSVVFEDRTECPCFLFFDIKNSQQFESYTTTYVNAFKQPAGQIIGEAEPILRLIDDKEFYFTIHGTNAVKGYGLIGYETLVRDGENWKASLGCDFAPLFHFKYQVPVQEESFFVPVEYTKEYSKITVQFVGIETFVDAGGRFPFDIVIRSGTCGINGLTGSPVRGDFQYRPEEVSMGRFEFNLPRQFDNDLSMELYGRPHIYEHEGYFRTFDFNAILRKDGNITWNEKNLPDLYIEIDYQQSNVEVCVLPWEENYLEFNN